MFRELAASSKKTFFAEIKYFNKKWKRLKLYCKTFKNSALVAGKRKTEDKGYASQDKTVKRNVAKFQQEESGIIIHSAHFQNIYW